MTRTDKTIVFCAILAVCGAFILNGCPRPTAAAEARTAPVKTAWTDKQTRDAQREAWDLLRGEYTELATAAIMGNLQHESRFCPFRVQGLTPEESATIRASIKGRNDFIYLDGGFGLAQWTGTTNLTRLWDYCEDNDLDVFSTEGQIRFLMDDYAERKPKSAARLNLYTLDQVSYATEDFRQSYEKSISTEQSKYQRTKSAKTIYAGFCSDIETIETVSTAPYYFDVYNIVNELNGRLENDNTVLSMS